MVILIFFFFTEYTEYYDFALQILKVETVAMITEKIKSFNILRHYLGNEFNNYLFYTILNVLRQFTLY